MILALVQARTSSSRLPNKVMLPILGRPMLAHQLERIARAKRVDRVMVATSVEPGDDLLADLCAELGVPVFRGSLNDVLDRFYRAAATVGPDYVVRLTGDCPLSDPGAIDDVVARAVEGGLDYACNVSPPTLPHGLDVEVIHMAALETAWREAELPSEREHVTPFIRTRPERFASAGVVYSPDLSHLRVTVDYPEDYDVVRAVFEALYPRRPDFGRAEMVAFLQGRPDLVAHNRGHPRSESLERSRPADEAFLARRR